MGSEWSSTEDIRRRLCLWATRSSQRVELGGQCLNHRMTTMDGGPNQLDSSVALEKQWSRKQTEQSWSILSAANCDKTACDVCGSLC